MLPTHIYWFSHYNLDAPSVRYRAKYALEELYKTRKITYSFVYPGYQFKNIVHFLKVFFIVLFFRKKNSLLVFQRIYTNRFYCHALKILLRFRKKNTLYDIDDAEYLNFPPETINYFMKNCEACSVGSKALIEYTKKFNPNVFLLTSPVIAHEQIKKEMQQVFTIGWIGFYNTDEKDEDEYAHKKSIYKLFFPALLDVNFKIKLIILGITTENDKKEIQDYFSGNKNIFIDIPENINWQDELSVYNRIKEFDIGVSPLLDNERNCAKSAFKLKQYLSCGVPSLGSSVGENATFLEHGHNGYICNTPEDYKKMIYKIKSFDEKTYQNFSSNARNSVIKFTLKNYCSELVRFYTRETVKN